MAGEDTVLRIGGDSSAAVRAVNEVQAAVSKLGPSLGQANVGVSEASKKFDAWLAGVKSTNKEIFENGERLKANAREIAGVSREVGKATGSFTDLAQISRATSGVLNGNTHSISMLATATTGLTAGTIALGVGIGAAVVTVTALGAAAAAASKYFVEQSGILQANERGIRDVAAAWDYLKFRTGEAIVGANHDWNDFLTSVADGERRLGDVLAHGIKNWRDYAAAVASAIPGGQLLVGLPAAAADATRMRWDFSGLGGVVRETNATPGANISRRTIDPATGQFVDTAAGILARSQSRTARQIELNGFTPTSLEAAERDTRQIHEDLVRRAREQEQAHKKWVAEQERAAEATKKWRQKVSDLTFGDSIHSAGLSTLAGPGMGLSSLQTGGRSLSAWLAHQDLIANSWVPAPNLPGVASGFPAGLIRSDAPPVTSGIPSWLLGMRPSASAVSGPGVGAQFQGLLQTQLGPTILGAIQGGGSIPSSIAGLFGSGLLSGELGTTITKGLTSTFGSTIGKTLGSFLPGIGALAGPLISGIVGHFTKYAPGAIAQQGADRDIRGIQAGLIEQHGSVANIAGMGRAGAEVAAAWNDKNVAGLANFKAKVDDLNRSLAEQERLTGEIGDAEAELAGLRDRQVPTWTDLQGAAEKYGVNIDALGPKFQQLKANDFATDLLSAFTDLTNAGGDVGGVLIGMSDEISHFVSESKRLGTSIPANMKPLIEELARSGNLTDDLGNKITDVSDLKWGDPVKTQAEIIADSIAAVELKIDNLQKALNDLDFDTMANRGVAAFGRVEDAATDAAEGGSPHGVKQIGVRSRLVIADVEQLGRVAARTFSQLEDQATLVGMARNVRTMDAATSGWGSSGSRTRALDGGPAPSAITVNNHIETYDAGGITSAIERKLLPRIIEAIAANRGGSLTQLQQIMNGKAA